jgi:hypothetical protein
MVLTNEKRSKIMYKEHTLPSGEVIWLTDQIQYLNPRKPFEVGCAQEDGEVRWTVYFATIEEAEKEYVRFN